MSDNLDIAYLENHTSFEVDLRKHFLNESVSVNIERIKSRDELVNKLAKKTFHLVILSQTSDEFEVLKTISIVENLAPDTHVVVLSSKLDETLVVNALKQGASDYFIVGRLDNLSSRIRSILRGNKTNSSQLPNDKNEGKINQIANHIPGAIYEFIRNSDGSYGFPTASRQFQQLFEVYTEDGGLDAEPVFSKIHLEDLESLNESVEDSALAMSKWDHEFRIVRQNGDVVWIRGMSTPVKQADDSILWSGILLDVTPQKQVEESLRRSEADLLAILNNMVETFYRIDLNDNLVMVSPSVENLLGYTPQELIGKKISDCFYEPAQSEKFLEHLRESKGIVRDYEAPLRHKSGEAVWFSMSASYYKGLDGVIAGVEGTARNISARHNAEVALRNSYEMLEQRVELRTKELNDQIAYNQAILDNTVDGIITIDVRGNIQTINPAVTTIFGYESDDLIGNNVSMLMAAPYRSEHNTYLENYLNTGVRKILGTGRQVAGRRKSGEEFPLELSVAEIQVAGDRIFTGLVRDITERINARKERIASEERLRRSQAFANIGSWDWDIQTGDLFWSERIGPLFGYPVGQLETTYDNFLNAVHPDDRQAVVDAVNACVEVGAEYDIEHRCVWPNGEVRWLYEKGDVVRDEEGAPLNMLGVVQDITDRKLADKALTQSEELLKQAQHIGHIGNWSFDVMNKTVFWSDEIFRIFGYEPHAIEPDYSFYCDRAHPDDVQMLRKGEQAIYESIKPTSMDHRIVRPDGNVRWIHVESIPHLNASGNAERVTGVIQDITERKEFEHTLLEAKNVAEKANKAKTDFLSSMSHELRTPLNAIIGFAQLFDFDDSLTIDQQENIKEISRAGKHLLELIGEILDLSRIEAGSILVNNEPVDIIGAVQEAVHLIQPFAEKNGIAIVADKQNCSSTFVDADPIRLRQVILNLLSNAIKYNKVDGKVFLKCSQLNEGLIQVSVRDTGKGLSTDALEDLYKPFDRLGAESTDVEGTGIGLVITKKLIELMNGELLVSSEPGIGSEFVFNLRIVNEDESGDGLTSRLLDEELSEKRGEYTVLYMEDNPANLKLVDRLLSRIDGVEFISAHEPEFGLALFQERKPDLVLLDINLPNMNGYEVVKRLREIEGLDDVPVVAISANAMPSDIEKSKDAGFNDYLTKPINVPEFYNMLDFYLKK